MTNPAPFIVAIVVLLLMIFAWGYLFASQFFPFLGESVDAIVEFFEPVIVR